MKYDFRSVEKKWQDKWDESGAFDAKDNSDKKKFYALKLLLKVSPLLSLIEW